MMRVFVCVLNYSTAVPPQWVFIALDLMLRKIPALTLELSNLLPWPQRAKHNHILHTSPRCCGSEEYFCSIACNKGQPPLPPTHTPFSSTVRGGSRLIETKHPVLQGDCSTCLPCKAIKTPMIQPQAPPSCCPEKCQQHSMPSAALDSQSPDLQCSEVHTFVFFFFCMYQE